MGLLLFVGVLIFYYVVRCYDSGSSYYYSQQDKKRSIESGCDFYFDGKGNMYHVGTNKRCTFRFLDDGYQLIDHNYNVLSEFHRNN